MDNPDWDLAKENIQPKRDGRNISNLNLGTTPKKVLEKKIHEEKQKYELAIRSSNHSDPLENWYRYIIWTEQHLPEGCDSDVRNLIENCIQRYKDEERYKNDKRYLCIWLKYAESLQDPIEVFNYLHSQNIGTTLSRFYESWAFALESRGQLSQADEVYKLGIARSAQPLERLQSHHRAFEHRLVKLIKEDAESREDEPLPPSSDSRNSLAPLKAKPRGAVSNDRVRAKSKVPQKPLKSVSTTNKTNGAGFAICCDENAPVSQLPTATGEWKKPPCQSKISKENSQKASQWNKAKATASSIAPTMQRNQRPIFDIHTDEQIVNKPAEAPNVLVMSERKPLSARKIDKPVEIIASSKSQNDSNFVLKYCKERVYMGNQEFSLEELRGMDYMRKNAPVRTKSDATQLEATNMVLDETLMAARESEGDETWTSAANNVPADDPTLTSATGGLPANEETLVGNKEGLSGSDEALLSAKKGLFGNDEVLSITIKGDSRNDETLISAKKGLPGSNEALMSAKHDTDIPAKKDVNKKLLFGRDDQNCTERKTSFNNPVEQQLDRASPQPITSPSRDAELLNKTESDGQLDISGFTILDRDDDFLPNFQSTAVIDPKKIRQESMELNSKRMPSFGHDFSTINTIEAELDGMDINKQQPFASKPIFDQEPKIDFAVPRVPKFNPEDENRNFGNRLASLSAVLDSPIAMDASEDLFGFPKMKEDPVPFLNSKPNQDSRHPAEKFAIADLSHHGLQMPAGIVKPAPLKSNFNALQSEQYDSKIKAQINNPTGFAIFQDDSDILGRASDNKSAFNGAFAKVNQDEPFSTKTNPSVPQVMKFSAFEDDDIDMPCMIDEKNREFEGAFAKVDHDEMKGTKLTDNAEFIAGETDGNSSSGHSANDIGAVSGNIDFGGAKKSAMPFSIFSDSPDSDSLFAEKEKFSVCSKTKNNGKSLPENRAFDSGDCIGIKDKIPPFSIFSDEMSQAHGGEEQFSLSRKVVTNENSALESSFKASILNKGDQCRREKHHFSIFSDESEVCPVPNRKERSPPARTENPESDLAKKKDKTQFSIFSNESEAKQTAKGNTFFEDFALKTPTVDRGMKDKLPFSIFSDENEMQQSAKRNTSLDGKQALKSRTPLAMTAAIPLSSECSVIPESKQDFDFAVPGIPNTPSYSRRTFPLVPKSPFAAPSPTVHTQKANLQISAMFNKTLDCEKNDFTLNLTEEPSIRNEFEQQFNMTNAFCDKKSATFKILEDSVVDGFGLATSNSSLHHSSAYVTQVAQDINQHKKIDLSPLQEVSEDETSKCSLSTTRDTDPDAAVSRYRFTSSGSEGQGFVDEGENDVLVPEDIASAIHCNDRSSTKDSQEADRIANLSLTPSVKNTEAVANRSVTSSGVSSTLPVKFDADFITEVLPNLDIENHPQFSEISPENVIGKFAVNCRIQLGTDTFKLTKKVGAGGFSNVYYCEFQEDETEDGVDDAQNAVIALKVVKSEDISLCRWEFYVSCKLHERISGIAPHLGGHFIEPLKGYSFGVGAAIAYPYYGGGTLLDLVNRNKQNGEKFDEKTTIGYTIQICHIVKIMHECGIIHGDVKPDNFLILSDITGDHKKVHRLTISDFGKSIDLGMFPPNVTFIGRSNTDKFECIEMTKGLPWKYQVDYYAVASTLHVIIHGSYMDVYCDLVKRRYKPMLVFKRNWDRPFWQSVFDRLLNVASCEYEDVLGTIISECEKKLASL